jgi:hypothetical protein
VVTKVVSRGQTGADQAGWRAARAFGIPTGGWMPRGFLTEEGSRPEFAELFGAFEMPTPDYRARTEQNVRDSDATVWFGDVTTQCARATLGACDKLSRSCLRVVPEGRLYSRTSPLGSASNGASGRRFKSRRPDLDHRQTLRSFSAKSCFSFTD